MTAHIMADIETLGLEAGSAIIAIGAVCFFDNGWNDLTDPGSSDAFYVEINAASCQDAGLAIDPATVNWWQQQEPFAKGLFDRVYMSGQGLPISEGLQRFSEFVQRRSEARVWGNGADFDNALLKAAYRKALDYPAPWNHRNNRCYRTLRAARPNIPFVSTEGTQHHAYYDALDQARHAQQLMFDLGATEI
jgi:exodeoxyribonuclease VIII